MAEGASITWEPARNNGTSGLGTRLSRLLAHYIVRSDVTPLRRGSQSPVTRLRSCVPRFSYSEREVAIATEILTRNLHKVKAMIPTFANPVYSMLCKAPVLQVCQKDETSYDGIDPLSKY